MKIDFKIVGLILLLSLIFCFSMGMAFYSQFKTNTFIQNIQSIIIERWWVGLATFSVFMGLSYKLWLSNNEQT